MSVAEVGYLSEQVWTCLCHVWGGYRGGGIATYLWMHVIFYRPPHTHYPVDKMADRHLQKHNKELPVNGLESVFWVLNLQLLHCNHCRSFNNIIPASSLLKRNGCLQSKLHKNLGANDQLRPSKCCAWDQDCELSVTKNWKNECSTKWFTCFQWKKRIVSLSRNGWKLKQFDFKYFLITLICSTTKIYSIYSFTTQYYSFAVLFLHFISSFPFFEMLNYFAFLFGVMIFILLYHTSSL